MTDLIPGQRVLLTFNPEHWPISSATYEYQGRDENGWWMRRLRDGVQRYFLNIDVLSVEPVADEVAEEERPY